MAGGILYWLRPDSEESFVADILATDALIVRGGEQSPSELQPVRTPADFRAQAAAGATQFLILHPSYALEPLVVRRVGRDLSRFQVEEGVGGPALRMSPILRTNPMAEIGYVTAYRSLRTGDWVDASPALKKFYERCARLLKKRTRRFVHRTDGGSCYVDHAATAEEFDATVNGRQMWTTTD